MRNQLLAIGTSILAFIVVPSGSLADIVDDNLWLARQIYYHSRQTHEVHEIKSEVLISFQKNDVDDAPGISSTDIEYLAAIHAAGGWASTLSLFLRNDLNADFQVTVDELRPSFIYNARSPLKSNGIKVMPTAEQVEEIVSAKIEEAMDADFNGDRVLTVDEIRLRHSQFKPQLGRPAIHQILAMLPTLDLDGDLDGVVTLDEFSGFADIVLAQMDRDENGHIDEEERRAFENLLHTKEKAQQQ